MADVIASGRWKSHKVNYFNFSSGVLNRTSSQTCGMMVFGNISIEGWIIDPYVQSLFYCSHLVQVLSLNNTEIVDGDTVTTDVAVVIYGRGGFQMFLEPFSRSILEVSKHI